MLVFCRVQTFAEIAIVVTVSTAALPLLVYWVYWCLRLMLKKGKDL
jgi:hypothetical protein